MVITKEGTLVVYVAFVGYAKVWCESSELIFLQIRKICIAHRKAAPHIQILSFRS